MVVNGQPFAMFEDAIPLLQLITFFKLYVLLCTIWKLSCLF